MFYSTPQSVNELGFKPSILVTATEALQNNPKLSQSIKHLGVIAILDPARYAGTWKPGISTKNACEALGVSSSTMFKHLGSEGMAQFRIQGEQSLFDDHRNPRYNVLKLLAFDLAIDKSLTIEDRIEKWGSAYATTANPGYIYKALMLFGRHGKDMVDQNAGLIDSATSLLIGNEAILAPGAGLQLTPLFGIIDQTDDGTLSPSFVSNALLSKVI